MVSYNYDFLYCLSILEDWLFIYLVRNGGSCSRTYLNLGFLFSLLSQLGSDIQREVQQAHLNLIVEDVEGAQLLKAITHLRFLHEDFGIAESDCRLVCPFTILALLEEGECFVVDCTSCIKCFEGINRSGCF